MKYMMLISILMLAFAGCSPEQPPAEDGEVTETATNMQQVEVALGEWYVRMEPNTVPEGPVQFHIHNEGAVVHSLAITGGDMEETSENLLGGEMTTMTADLPAGEYDAICPISDHAARGMRTTFTVTAAE